jgi:hypothetical protein
VSPVVFDRPTVIAFQEEGAGADVSLDLGKHLRIRSEGVVQHREYDPGKREPGPFPGSYKPDFTLVGAYALVAYRFPVGIEPYVYAEHDSGFLEVAQALAGISGGVNLHFTPWTQLKIQYQYNHLYDTSDYYHRDQSHSYTHFLNSRLVVAF